MKHSFKIFLLVLVLSPFVSAVYASSKGYVYSEEMVPSGVDSIRLLTRIYLPEGEGPFPVVVTRTPYVFNNGGDYIEAGRDYARRGIGYIQQDCRGKGGSEGFYSPNIYERQDGIALYRWLDRQPWCREIGIFGGSYTALTGFIVADSLPAKVKAMHLSHYGVDRHISCYRAGLFRTDIMSGWMIDNAEEPIIRPKREPDQPQGSQFYPFCLYRPHVLADSAILGMPIPYYRDWITHTDYTDPYWNTGVWNDLKTASASISVPVTIVAGQFDHHEEGTILGFEHLAPEVRKHSRLILGAWNHSFLTTPTHTPHEHAKQFDIAADVFNWFSSILVDHQVPESEVKVYNIEADRWESFSSWPMPVVRDKVLYLSAEQLNPDKANVLRLSDKKSRKKVALTYAYDPDSPIMAEGGETLFNSSEIRGCHPMSPAGYRPDMLCFLSEPLAEDLTIGGEVRLRLFVRSDCDDTAFAFTLAEVTPDGTAYNMRTSITTLGYRKGLLEPRVPYQPGSLVEIEIVALPMLWTVRAGNAIRLDIKSSQFPEYAVHTNYAGVWAEQSRSRIAHQTVISGGLHPSKLILPLVK